MISHFSPIWLPSKCRPISRNGTQSESKFWTRACRFGPRLPQAAFHLCYKSPGMKHPVALPLTTVFALIILTYPALSTDTNTRKPVKKTTVALKDAKGISVGSATIKASGKGVEVKLDVKN